METKNAFLAIFLSMAVLFGYQILFPPPPPPAPVAEQAPPPQAAIDQNSAPVTVREAAVAVASLPVAQQKPIAPSRPAREIVVETSLYTAIFGEDGGTIKSFRLNNYQESAAADSDLKELVHGGSGHELPLFFSWGTAPSLEVPIYQADQTRVTTSKGSASLRMSGKIAGGLTVIRTLTFHDDNYLIDLAVEVLVKLNGLGQIAAGTLTREFKLLP